MRKFKEYIMREDEIALKMKKIPGGSPSYMDPSMAYYIRRMSKNKQPRFKMKDL